MARPTYPPPEPGQPDCESRVFSCDLDELAPLLDREGAEFGLVAVHAPSGVLQPEGRSLAWHRPSDARLPAELVLFAQAEGGRTALSLRAQAPAGEGLLDSDGRRHAFSLMAGALSSGVLAVGISLLMLGPNSPLLPLVLVGLTVVLVTLSILVIWGLCRLWARAQALRARARALRLRREAGAQLFAALERALRRAGPYRLSHPRTGRGGGGESSNTRCASPNASTSTSMGQSERPTQGPAVQAPEPASKMAP